MIASAGRIVLVLLTLLVGEFHGEALLAQVAPGSLASQTLRDYTHVFAAYAIAWLLILGWIVSVARRLQALERRFED